MEEEEEEEEDVFPSPALPPPFKWTKRASYISCEGISISLSLSPSSSLTTRDPTFYLARKIFVVTQTSHGLILLSRWQGCFDPLRRMSPSLLFIPAKSFHKAHLFNRFEHSNCARTTRVRNKLDQFLLIIPPIGAGNVVPCCFLSIETIINFQ